MTDKKKPTTYAQAGVDIRSEDTAIKGIKGWMQKTFKFREGKFGSVSMDIGGYANVVEVGPYLLAITTDGVGSKVLVAQELNKYDTVGIDVVAMNVNDLICVGAEPISMVDYLAVTSVNEHIIRDICAGIYEGARQAQIAVVGGETATLPEIITGQEGHGFDLAATAVGIIERGKVITGEKIRPGDLVVGIKSSGVHSNGLTLARKVLPRDMWAHLLTPTRIYVKEAMTLMREYDIHGFAHITGSAFLKVRRLTNYGFTFDSLPEPQPVFKKIKELGGITDEEMHKTFNMGVGFCVIASPEDANAMVEKYGQEYQMTIVGRVDAEPGVRVKVGDKLIKP
ncbi:Phosphoribosylformylglycinamidine cyclo-ligase [uncultured archaeon]|nr:Phosphoribosylformylglycinamidine cyclo-ligase [uncultured archaeon]